MNERLESSIERAVVKKMKAHGVQGIKFTSPGNTGYPDRIFLFPGGRPVFVEFKRPGQKPRPKQKFIIDFLQGLGYTVLIHDDVNNAVAELLTYLEPSHV